MTQFLALGQCFASFLQFGQFSTNVSSVNVQSMLHQKRKKEKKTLDPSLANFMKFSKMTIVSFLSTSMKPENLHVNIQLQKLRVFH